LNPFSPALTELERVPLFFFGGDAGHIDE